MAEILKTKLEDLKALVTGSSTLTVDEKLKLSSWWNDNIKFNIQNYKDALLIIKMNPSKIIKDITLSSSLLSSLTLQLEYMIESI